jgi:hypothetical protein
MNHEHPEPARHRRPRMSPMTSPEQHPRRPLPRWRALLMLGLLAGLLGTHALAPCGLTPACPMTVAQSMEGDCADGNCGGSHIEHADST